MFLAVRRLFARRPVKAASPADSPQDPELMALVEKHVNQMIAQGFTPEQIIQKSFGGDVLKKLPHDPDQALQDVDLASLNMEVDPHLMEELQKLISKKTTAAEQKVTSDFVPSDPIALPSAYKQSDIEKVTSMQRLQKLREKTQPK